MHKHNDFKLDNFPIPNRFFLIKKKVKFLRYFSQLNKANKLIKKQTKPKHTTHKEPCSPPPAPPQGGALVGGGRVTEGRTVTRWSLHSGNTGSSRQGKEHTSSPTCPCVTTGFGGIWGTFVPAFCKLPPVLTSCTNKRHSLSTVFRESTKVYPFLAQFTRVALTTYVQSSHFKQGHM